MPTFIKHYVVDIVIPLQKYDFGYCNVGHLTGGRALLQRCLRGKFQARDCKGVRAVKRKNYSCDI